DQIGIERQYSGDVRGDEGRDARFLAPYLRRPHGIAGYADDPVLLAEQIKRLDRLFGQTDDTLGRKDTHRAPFDPCPVPRRKPIDLRTSGPMVARCHLGYYRESGAFPLARSIQPS